MVTGRHTKEEQKNSQPVSDFLVNKNNRFASVGRSCAETNLIPTNIQCYEQTNMIIIGWLVAS